eukprot:544022-Prorocentrum_minimum.AAC.3
MTQSNLCRYLMTDEAVAKSGGNRYNVDSNFESNQVTGRRGPIPSCGSISGPCAPPQWRGPLSRQNLRVLHRPTKHESGSLRLGSTRSPAKQRQPRGNSLELESAISGH